MKLDSTILSLYILCAFSTGCSAEGLAGMKPGTGSVPDDSDMVMPQQVSFGGIRSDPTYDMKFGNPK